MKVHKSSPTQTGWRAPPVKPADLMTFFYPVHYQISTTLEDILGDGLLSRRQVVLLQLVRSEGSAGLPGRRKIIEQAMKHWFEMSTSSISKALRALLRPPLESVRVGEYASSGRGRVVELSTRGAEFLDRTTARAGDYFTAVVAKMDLLLLAQGAEYLRQLTGAYQRAPRAGRAAGGTITMATRRRCAVVAGRWRKWPPAAAPATLPRGWRRVSVMAVNCRCLPRPTSARPLATCRA